MYTHIRNLNENKMVKICKTNLTYVCVYIKLKNLLV